MMIPSIVWLLPSLPLHSPTRAWSPDRRPRPSACRSPGRARRGCPPNAAGRTPGAGRAPGTTRPSQTHPSGRRAPTHGPSRPSGTAPTHGASRPSGGASTHGPRHPSRRAPMHEPSRPSPRRGRNRWSPRPVFQRERRNRRRHRTTLRREPALKLWRQSRRKDTTNCQCDSLVPHSASIGEIVVQLKTSFRSSKKKMGLVTPETRQGVLMRSFSPTPLLTGSSHDTAQPPHSCVNQETEHLDVVFNKTQREYRMETHCGLRDT